MRVSVQQLSSRSKLLHKNKLLSKNHELVLHDAELKVSRIMDSCNVAQTVG